MKEVVHQTIKRQSSEPKLEIGERVSLKDDLIGVVRARYVPASSPNEVCYVVEVISDKSGRTRT